MNAGVLGLRRTKGRAVVADYCVSFTRELSPGDVIRIETEERGVTSPALQRITARHHKLARLIASGNSPHWALALETGLTESRISILLGDPTFKSLVEYYAAGVNEKFYDAVEELAGLGQDVIAELRARMDESPKEFSHGQLNELLKSTMDRTGIGPSSTNTSVQFNINIAQRLNAARSRVIDITPKDDANG